MTSDTKKETGVRVGVQHADETEAKSPAGSFSRFTEQRRDSPVYSRVPVPRTSPKPVRVEPPLGKGKSQEADLNTVSVTGKEENTESPAETPKESTSKTAPSHVHPKLPTDYDSFAAHFMSLRTNRR
jgi:vacuolar protein sorting-associated protein IST1